LFVHVTADPEETVVFEGLKAKLAIVTFPDAVGMVEVVVVVGVVLVGAVVVDGVEGGVEVVVDGDGFVAPDALVTTILVTKKNELLRSRSPVARTVIPSFNPDTDVMPLPDTVGEAPVTRGWTINWNPRDVVMVNIPS
jgi:hypothetical protein